MSNVATIIKQSERSFMDKSQALDFGTEAHFALQAISKNNHTQKIAMANPGSLKSAMINVAAIGLSLNPANKDAYLVPRDGAICLDISYQGLIKLATQTGAILWAQAEIVYERDGFTHMGVGSRPAHKFNAFGDRGNPVGVYCVAKTPDGDYMVDTMSAEEIEQVRQTSKAKDSNYSPWNTFPMEMWKKTVIKRAFKTWPKTAIQNNVLHEAVEVLNQHEGLQERGVSEEQHSYYKSLIESQNALGLWVFYAQLPAEDQADIGSAYINRNAGRGEKGKLRESVRELLNKGQSMVEDYRLGLEEADDLGIMELINELSTDELDFILAELSKEAQERVKTAQQQEAA